MRSESVSYECPVRAVEVLLLYPRRLFSIKRNALIMLISHGLSVQQMARLVPRDLQFLVEL